MTKAQLSKARSRAAKVRWQKHQQMRAALQEQHPLVMAFLELPEASRRRIAEALLAGLSGDARIVKTP